MFAIINIQNITRKSITQISLGDSPPEYLNSSSTN